MAYIGFGPVNTFSPVPSKDSFTGDGSTTAFDVENEVVFGGENALEVFVDNVRQEPGTGKAYTLDLDGNLNNCSITCLVIDYIYSGTTCWGSRESNSLIL